MPKGKARPLTPAELDAATEITPKDIERAKERAAEASKKLGQLVNTPKPKEDE